MGLKKQLKIKGAIIPSDTEVAYLDGNTYVLDTVGDQTIGRALTIKSDGIVRLKVSYYGGYYNLNYQLNGINRSMGGISAGPSGGGTLSADITVKKNDILKLLPLKKMHRPMRGFQIYTYMECLNSIETNSIL